MENIITHEDPQSLIAEAYRVLRTNILFSNVDKALKSFVITSFGKGEGKTTVIVNLAVTFSQQGSKVLLIDGDLRKPRIHQLLHVENDIGLTNFLTSHDEYKNYIKTSRIKNLDILVCGTIPPNPSELLMSSTMKQFLTQIKNDYDIILIDAPPVGLVTDAAILSANVDGTVLVAASGGVSVDSLARAKENLDKVNANILGVVLNKLDKSNTDNYYQYSYYNDSNELKRKKGRR